MELAIMNKYLLAVSAFFCTFLFVSVSANSANIPNNSGQYRQYCYDLNNQIRAIENYNILEGGSKQLFCRERFDWHPKDNEKLVARILEDSEGNILISQAFDYDNEGTLLEEINWKIEDGPLYVRHSYYYDENNRGLKKSVICKNQTNNDFPSNLVETSDTETLSEEYTFQEPLYPPTQNSLKDAIASFDDSIEIGLYGQGKSLDKVKITFINGIMNSRIDLINSVERLSTTHGNTPIYYAFCISEGWTWDLLKSSLAKLGFVSSHAKALATLWKCLIDEMGGPQGGGTIIHYAHSIGGTNTLAAKSLLTPEEQKMIQVITLGSPTMIPNDGFQSVINYVSIHDWIPLLDPISRFLSLFNASNHIVWVGNPDEIPTEDRFFVSHYLEGVTYNKLLLFHGEQFMKLHLE
jgi:hypothetical protein